MKEVVAKNECSHYADQCWKITFKVVSEDDGEDTWIVCQACSESSGFNNEEFIVRKNSIHKNN